MKVAYDDVLQDPTPPRALPSALRHLPKGPFAFQAPGEGTVCSPGRTQSLPASPEPTNAPLPRWAAQKTFSKPSSEYPPALPACTALYCELLAGSSRPRIPVSVPNAVQVAV